MVNGTGRPSMLTIIATDLAQAVGNDGVLVASALEQREIAHVGGNKPEVSQKV